MVDSPGAEWYLSFDCATKSFAWALLRLDDDAGALAEIKARRAADLLADAGRLLATRGGRSADDTLGMLEPLIDEARRELEAALEAAGGLLTVVAGGAADLVPGIKDKNIPGIERVRALKRYVDAAVWPALEASGAPDDASLRVAIEFQLGANFHARAVATALVTIFVDCSVFFVGPAHKNRVSVSARPDLAHCYFVEKHTSLYAANKAHAKALLEVVEEAFPFTLGIPKALRKDFADALLQVLAFRKFGPGIDRAAEYF